MKEITLEQAIMENKTHKVIAYRMVCGVILATIRE